MKKYKYVNEEYRQAYKKAEKKFKENAARERPVDEDPVSNCCNAHFTCPGWPDSDLCSKCFEHADIQEEEDSDDYYKDIQQDR